MTGMQEGAYNSFGLTATEAGLVEELGTSPDSADLICMNGCFFGTRNEMLTFSRLLVVQ